MSGNNILLGYGAALPSNASSNQIVLGNGAATVVMGGGAVRASAAGLQLSALTITGATPTPGAPLLSGGPGAAPYWGPTAVNILSGESYTLTFPTAQLYTLSIAIPEFVLSSGNNFKNAQITVKNLVNSTNGTLTASTLYALGGTVNIGTTGSNLGISIGAGATYTLACDGTAWYVLSVGQAA